MTPALADALGFAGALMTVGGYAYQTMRRAAPDLLSGGLNFVGASLLALSLTVHYNLPALTLESVWAAIALAGVVRQWRWPA